MKKFKGIFPALLTPFTRDNRINEKSLQKLIKINLDKGVDGFYVGGSTGEAFLLSIDERKYLLDIVAQEAKGKCTIISHIGCISTEQAIELGKHAEKVGIDAVSSIPPFYYNFSFEEIKNYYFDIVNNINLPMIIYNFPAFSGVNLNSENVKEFFNDKRFIGLKHTSSDFFSLERIKSANRNVIIYNGFDEMFLAGLAMGADGGIGSTYNFMADKFILMKNLFDIGKIDDARKIQEIVNDIIKIIIKVGVLPGEKEILNMMGLDFGECRKPFKRLSEEDKGMLKGVVESLMTL
jgi:N-acetylneuraminate lyase